MLKTIPDTTLLEQLVYLRPRMFKYAISLTHNQTAAEDLLGQACVKILESLYQFQSGSNFGAWCNVILYHIFISNRRRQKIRAERSLNEMTLADEDSAASYDPALVVAPLQESRVIAKEMLERLKTVTPTQRTMMLAAGFGISIVEMSEYFNMTEGTVKSTISRGRARTRLVEAE